MVSDPYQLQRRIDQLERRVEEQRDEIRKLRLIHRQLNLRLYLLEQLINRYRLLEDVLEEAISGKNDTNRYLM